MLGRRKLDLAGGLSESLVRRILQALPIGVLCHQKEVQSKSAIPSERRNKMDLCTAEIVIFIKSFGDEELRTDLAGSSARARERNKLPLQYEASIGWLLPEGGQMQPGRARAGVVFALRIPSRFSCTFFKKTV